MEANNESNVAVNESVSGPDDLGVSTGQDVGGSTENGENVSVQNQTPSPMNPAGQAVDIAAKQFQLYQPVFKNRIKQLSRKQLIRLMSALVEYPLQEKPYKHNEKFEKDAFLIGNQLLESKYMMIMFTMLESQQLTQELETLASEATETSQNNTNSEGVQNG